MKAITLTQPWATLVALGAKKIETRSWSTSYRGPLAIHAAKKFPESAQHLCFREPFREILIARYGFMHQGEIYFGKHKFPLGCVIAVCELVICIQIPTLATNFFIPVTGIGDVALPPAEPEHSFGDYAPGRYAWILGNVQLLPEPIPARGSLGLWEWDKA